MGTREPYDQPVPKGKWSPPTDEIAAELQALREMQQAAIDAAAEADARIRAATTALAAKGVPIATLAETLGVGRKTVYGYTGRPMR
jgi:uncharacterized membrane protein